MVLSAPEQNVRHVLAAAGQGLGGVMALGTSLKASVMEAPGTRLRRVGMPCLEGERLIVLIVKTCDDRQPLEM